MSTLHSRDWEPGKVLNGFVYRCSHLVFGLLLCFVSAAGLQGHVTGDGAYRCGLREKKRTQKYKQFTAGERSKIMEMTHEFTPLISLNSIRFIRTFPSLFYHLYFCTVGCYGDC